MVVSCKLCCAEKSVLKKSVSDVSYICDMLTALGR